MNANILIVSDNPVVGSWLKEFLEFNVFHITMNGAVPALPALSEGRFNVVLVDAAYPSCLETIEVLRQAHSTEEAWVIVAAFEQQDVPLAHKCPADLIIEPTVTMRKILGAIRTLMHRTPVPRWRIKSDEERAKLSRRSGWYQKKYTSAN